MEFFYKCQHLQTTAKLAKSSLFIMIRLIYSWLKLTLKETENNLTELILCKLI